MELAYLHSTHSHEELISLSNISEKIKVFPYYYKQQFDGAYNGCDVRKGVAQKLITVANQLPPDYYLVILDGWRSFETQTALYEMTKQQHAHRFEDEKLLLQFISSFVALPSKQPASPHYSGGAVDLTIAYLDGWLNMGTDFDAFTENAAALYYEQKENLTQTEINIRNNRRLLRSLMEAEDFTIHPNEWWHFDYGNIRWAKQKNTHPLYDGIERTI